MLPTGFERSNRPKRQVKAPKIYFRDSGLLLALLGVGDHAALALRPRLGASWEGFALEETLKIAQPDDAHFWATHAGAELDLLMIKHARRVGVEFKRADAPRITASMRIAMQDLRLDALYVVHPGALRYLLDQPIEAVPIAELAQVPPWNRTALAYTVNAQSTPAYFAWIGSGTAVTPGT